MTPLQSPLTLQHLLSELEQNKNSIQAKTLQRFFKTGKGEYGEGDIFLGIKVPVQRSIIKNYDLPLSDIQKLLDSKVHEHRLCALFILVKKFKSAIKEKDTALQKEIVDFYLLNAKKGTINNWDLVDLSAPNILGEYLVTRKKERTILYTLARSSNLWEKRISVLASFSFLRHDETKDTLALANILLHDNHDLIQKAVGWMLREIGKRVSEKELRAFLDTHASTMPRTTLRYAIERLPEKVRKQYLQK